MTAAREAILRWFPEAPRPVPEDLGIVFTAAGVERFVAAADVVEITPPLAVAPLPGSAGGVAFWRGKAYEVRGESARAANFLLVGGPGAPFFVVSESRPRAASRAEVPGAREFREPHVG